MTPLRLPEYSTGHVENYSLIVYISSITGRASRPLKYCIASDFVRFELMRLSKERKLFIAMKDAKTRFDSLINTTGGFWTESNKVLLFLDARPDLAVDEWALEFLFQFSGASVPMFLKEWAQFSFENAHSNKPVSSLYRELFQSRMNEEGKSTSRSIQKVYRPRLNFFGVLNMKFFIFSLLIIMFGSLGLAQESSTRGERRADEIPALTPIYSRRCIKRKLSGDCGVWETIAAVRGVNCTNDCLIINDNLYTCRLNQTCTYDPGSGCFRKQVCNNIDRVRYDCRDWQEEIVCR